MEKMQICKICGEQSKRFDCGRVLDKYNANYYHCSSCGFVQTEEPYWLEESYTSAIASADTGILARNLRNAKELLFLLKPLADGSFIDFGGGHGILTRIMRDYGFDFFHYDKYAENLFARGFDANLCKKYHAITAYESFEHFTEPLKDVEKLLSLSDTIIFSTLLISSPPPKVSDWWYYVPETGQHISFYSRKSLQVIAKRYNLLLQSNNKDLHILSKLPLLEKKIFPQLKWYNRIQKKLDITRKFKKKSKTRGDMQTMLERQ